MASGLSESKGWTSLHEAAAAHPRELLRLEELIKTGAVEVNQQSWCGETLLHVACQYKCVEGVKEAVCLLLQNGANVNMRDKQGRTPLLCAAKKGNLDAVATLLSLGHADPDLCDIFGQNPLYESANLCNWEIVECLLQAGASLPVHNRYGGTPVHLAADFGHSRCLEKLLQVAVEKGQKEVIDARNGDGFTPLMNAAYEGHVECVEVLLRFGANPYLKVGSLLEVNGSVTALHFAIYDDHADCIKLLLDNMDLQHLVYHADHSSSDYVCPLQAAIQKRNHGLLKRLLSLGFPVDNVHIYDWQVMNLIRRPFVYNEPLPKFQTSLSYAAAVKDVVSMQILLDFGASVNPVLYDIVNKNEVEQKLSLPPILSALCSRSWKAFDLLMKYGCDVGCQPDGICPSVCLLLSFYDYDSAKNLLILGSDPHLIFQQGNDNSRNILSYMGCLFTDIGCEAFFRILELLLQFLVISGRVQRLFYDVFNLCHQLKPEWCAEVRYDERWKAILQQVDKPSSLENLCRAKIRQVLTSEISVLGYFMFEAAVHRLCLPKELQRYLLHSEIKRKKLHLIVERKQHRQSLISFGIDQF